MFAVTNSGKEWTCIFIHDKCKLNLNLWRLLFSEKWVSKKKSSARYERTDSRSGKQMFSENNTYQFIRYSYKFMLLSLFNHVWGLPWCFSVTVHILCTLTNRMKPGKGFSLQENVHEWKRALKDTLGNDAGCGRDMGIWWMRKNSGDYLEIGLAEQRMEAAKHW